MSRFKNLAGQRFGLLVAVRCLPPRKASCTYRWECVCDCGNKKIVDAAALLKGTTRSCGCLRSIPNKIYSVGDVSICIIQGREGSGYFWFDTEDLALVVGYQWHINKQGYAIGYARGSGGKNTQRARLSKAILGVPYGRNKDIVVDHINGDVCDNRKCNLRICTTRENVCHQKGVRGYSITRGGKYGARITVNGEVIWLGAYDTPEEAAAAYKAASILHHKEFGAHNGYTYYPGCPDE